MPVSFHVRPKRCTGCDDVVLVREHSLGTLFGLRVGNRPTVRLEHADPGPDGELFDPVDDACRRARPAAPQQ